MQVSFVFRCLCHLDLHCEDIDGGRSLEREASEAKERLEPKEGIIRLKPPEAWPSHCPPSAGGVLVAVLLEVLGLLMGLLGRLHVAFPRAELSQRPRCASEVETQSCDSGPRHTAVTVVLSLVLRMRVTSHRLGRQPTRSRRWRVSCALSSQKDETVLD